MSKLSSLKLSSSPLVTVFFPALHYSILFYSITPTRRARRCFDCPLIEMTVSISPSPARLLRHLLRRVIPQSARNARPTPGQTRFDVGPLVKARHSISPLAFTNDAPNQRHPPPSAPLATNDPLSIRNQQTRNVRACVRPDNSTRACYYYFFSAPIQFLHNARIDCFFCPKLNEKKTK